MHGSKITEKILKEAEEQAKEIIKQAEAEAKAILEDAEKEKKFIIESAKKEAEEVAKKEKEKKIGLEVIELRKKVLQAKREIMDSVFVKVEKKLQEESKGDFLKHIASFIKALKLKGKFEVIPGDREKRVDEGFVKELAKATGLELTLSNERARGYHGFTLKQGKIEINLAPEVIIPDLKDELEDQIKGLLFEE